MLIGYARVSKGEQDNALQLGALERAGATRIYQEQASGGRWDRPELHRALEQLREGDVLVVWKLDRLSRSLKDFLTLLEQVEARGAGFRSLTESVDATPPAGRMMMQMVGAFAEAVQSGRKTAADCARLFGVSQATVSRIVRSEGRKQQAITSRS